MVYGYHITSTKEQHLDRGIAEITKYCEEHNMKLEKVYTDQQTGKNFERARYIVLTEDVLRAGDILIITEIDRLGRTKQDTLDELRKLREKDVRVMVLELPTTLIDYSSIDNEMAKMMMETVNNMMIELYASMAEAEMHKKQKRQKEGYEALKARGEWDKLGRPAAIDYKKFCKEYEKGEETIDICKIAVLKYYSTREYTTTVRKTLKKFLQELCGKQIYFPFFLAYEKEWLIELQLWDKTLIEYKGQKGSRVMLYYQLQKENSEAVDYATEVLTPMYENLYVKKFVLFSNERLKYYFKETIDGNTYRSDKECCMKDAVFGESGRYGRLNDILLSEGSEKEEKMKAYAQEDAIAAHMFEQY